MNCRQRQNGHQIEALRFIKKTNKVCIIGFAPSWNETPWNLNDMDYWGINELYRQAVNKKFTAWFETHDIKNSPSKQEDFHQDFLKKCSLPLVTLQHWDEYPSSLAYPREYIKEYFNRPFILTDGGAGFSDYSNQISWLIALAICLGYEEIQVYGVDMAQASEYAFQRASCQFFIGWAAASGIKMFIPASCELLKGGGDYGFETDNTNRHRKKSRITSFQEQLKRNSIRLKEIEFYIEDELKKELEIKTAIENEKIKYLIAQANATREREAKIKLQHEIDSINKNIFNKRKDVSINIRLLEEEAKQLKHNNSELNGLINECKHDLNNNLV